MKKTLLAAISGTIYGIGTLILSSFVGSIIDKGFDLPSSIAVILPIVLLGLGALISVDLYRFVHRAWFKDTNYNTKIYFWFYFVTIIVIFAFFTIQFAKTIDSVPAENFYR